MHLVILEPRGFCAGVRRAIETVRHCLKQFGAPIYVKHAIVHNKHVVDELADIGAIFVENLEDIPSESIVIFSAHGSPKKDFDKAKQLNLKVVNATCPLVQKVHRMSQKFQDHGDEIIVIGDPNHVEIIGISGQLANKPIIVETIEDAKAVQVQDPNKIAYVTQTTLSVDDAQDIVDILQDKFPNINGLHKDNICYATQNRQNAIKAIASRVDTMIVIGSKQSSNSNKLYHLSQKYGIRSCLIHKLDELDISWLKESNNIGITAGASTPEILVQDVKNYIVEHYSATVEYYQHTQENVEFHPPIIRF